MVQNVQQTLNLRAELSPIGEHVPVSPSIPRMYILYTSNLLGKVFPFVSYEIHPARKIVEARGMDL
jgi:hypothetical protein